MSSTSAGIAIGRSAYSASKAALQTMAKTLAWTVLLI